MAVRRQHGLSLPVPVGRTTETGSVEPSDCAARMACKGPELWRPQAIAPVTFRYETEAAREACPDMLDSRRLVAAHSTGLDLHSYGPVDDGESLAMLTPAPPARAAHPCIEQIVRAVAATRRGLYRRDRSQ